MNDIETLDFIELIDAVLIEDIQEGDHTTLATIDADAIGKAKLLVKEHGIIAGVDLAEKILKHVSPEIEIDKMIPDGAWVEPGFLVFTATGRIQALLIAERTLLNFMQRMSGIATRTNLFVQSVRGTKAKILDTRKTIPGLRYFDKWAVRLGGGYNHRMGLYDMVMIKDNHIDYCGGIENAIDRVQLYLEENKIDIPVEIETRNIVEVKQVLAKGGVNRIMLDNFKLEDLHTAVGLIGNKFEIEASGGINLDTVSAIAAAGVDFISVGELTHSVKGLDLSFKAIIHTP